MAEGTEDNTGDGGSTKVGGDDKTALTEGEKPSGDDKTVSIEGEKPSGDDKTVLTEGSQKAEDDDKPIEYTDFKVPEGMEVDKDALADFLPYAQAQKLSQEDAQKYIDIFAKGAERVAKANADNWVNLKKTWVETAKSDKEIGGERYDESVKLAKLAIDKLGTKELVMALETTGFGDNPEFIRIFSKVGKIIEADGFNFGGAMGEGSRNRAEIMYGTPAQQ